METWNIYDLQVFCIDKNRKFYLLFFYFFFYLFGNIVYYTAAHAEVC